MGSPLLVLGIPGSLRPGSHTAQAITIALRGAAEVGARTEQLDLGSLALPFCDGRDDESTYPPGVERLRSTVKAAHGILLGTPEYHGSYSGVLKNALDLMGFEEFEGKMVGLVGVSGGRTGAAKALAALRDTGRVLHAWVVPSEAGIPDSGKAFGPDGRLTNPNLEERVMGVGREVARFAALHTSAEAHAFLRAWEGAAANPGGQGR